MLVVEHFTRRRTPRWLFDLRAKTAELFPTRNFSYDLPIQPEWMKRALRYDVYDCGRTDHYHRLTKAVDWDRAWIREIGSTGWLSMGFGFWALHVAGGYAATRNPAYARAFLRYFNRWLEDFPTGATDIGLRDGGNLNTLDPCFVEGAMALGRRAFSMTDVLYSGLLEALSADDAFRVLKYIWFLASLFAGLRKGETARQRFHAGNHNLFEYGTAPYCLGVVYPEFTCSPELLRKGRALIHLHASDRIAGEIRPDFSSWEHSSHYAWYAAWMFQVSLVLSRLNEVPLLSDRQEMRVLTHLDHFADLTAPDGTLVPYGDQQHPGDRHLRLASEVMSNSRSERAGKRLGLDVSARTVRRTRRPTRKNDRNTARHFSSSGIVVARSGWSRHDSLLFVIGPPPDNLGGHNHHDFTSFQLWANGQPLFIDTATWAYRIDRRMSNDRGYHYSAFCHNLLTVEGYRSREEFKLMGTLRWWGDRKNGWTVTEQCRLEGSRGCVRMHHNAYPGMIVTRCYRFDLKERWVSIKDIVKAEMGKRRVFRQWLHPWFGAKTRAMGKDKGTALRVDAGSVQALCTWDSTEPLALVAEPSPEVMRAARLFDFGKPMRAYAECVTPRKTLEINCRIEW